MATVYVRYKQVEALIADEGVRLSRLNCVGLLLGLVSSFGMCVVANFQVRATGSQGWEVRWSVWSIVQLRSSRMRLQLHVCVCARAEDHAVPRAHAGSGAHAGGRGPVHPGPDADLTLHAAAVPQQDLLHSPTVHRDLDPVQHHQQYLLIRVGFCSSVARPRRRFNATSVQNSAKVGRRTP